MNAPKYALAREKIYTSKASSPVCPLIRLLGEGILSSLIDAKVGGLNGLEICSIEPRIIINTPNEKLSLELIQFCGICQSCIASMSNRPVKMLNQPVVFSTIMNRNGK